MSSKFGGWSIDKKTYNYIRKVVPAGGTILELGSGAITDVLALHYTMYSVEHDKEWVDKYNSTYIHAPLCEHKAIKNHPHTRWYDADVLRPKLKGIKYDLLLIDGPPATRSGFFKYMNMFDSNAIWLFDDSNRTGDRAVVNSVANRLDRPWVTYHSGPDKTFGVINDPFLNPFTNEETP